MGGPGRGKGRAGKGWQRLEPSDEEKLRGLLGRRLA